MTLAVFAVNLVLMFEHGEGVFEEFGAEHGRPFSKKVTLYVRGGKCDE
jgi:hypothetical protein